MPQAEMFGHTETTRAVALPLIRAAIVREIGLRRGCYPRWVAEGRRGMTHEIAAAEIAAMEGALHLFDGIVALAGAAQGLRDMVVFEVLTVKPEFASKFSRRVELVDAALAQVDRYKCVPQATEGGSDEPQSAFR